MSDDDEPNDNDAAQIGVRVSTALKERVKAAAKAEERTESGFTRYHLARAADAVLGGEQ